MRQPTVADLFAGNGEIAALMRSHIARAQAAPDDALQPFLTDVETWPFSLKNAFAILLNSSCPMFLVWDFHSIPGCDRVLFYNDAYLSLLNETQQTIPLGRSLNDCWNDDWASIRVDIEQVFATGQALQCEQAPFPPNHIASNNRLLCTWAYSALWDETGQIGGVFVTGCQVTADLNSTSIETSQAGQSLHSTPPPRTTPVQSSLEQTEAALHESEARFRAFMRHSPTAAWIADSDGRLLYLSPTYRQMFQVPQQDAVGKQINTLYSEEFAQEFLENNHRVFETGQAVETVESAPRSDGSIGSFLVYKFPIIQSSQETLLGGVAIDITEHKRTEDRLRHREEELRLLTNTLPVLIAYVDKNRCYRFNNQTYESWFGQPTTRFTGQHIRDVLGDAAYAAILPYVEQAFSGQRVSFESRLEYREGGTRYVQADYVPHINSQGEVEGFFSLVSDISERKRVEDERKRADDKRRQTEEYLRASEERFRFVTQAVSGLIFDWNLQTNTVYRSEKLYDLIGINPNDAPPEAHWWHGRIHPEDLARLQPQLDELLASDAQLHEAEYRVRHADGHWVDVWEQACLIRDEQGQVVRIVGCTVDISDRKRSEQVLIESETLARTRAEELTALMEITPAAIWIARDPDCHHMTANQAAYTLMRVKSGSETSATPEDGNYPLPFTICKNGQEVLPHELTMQRAVRTNQAVTDELEFVFKDGTIQTIYGKAVPLYDAAANIRGSIAAFVDISDRKRMEEALRTSEERLRFAIEGASLGTWEYDLASSQLVWSDQAKRMFGLPLDIELDYEGFMLALHPDDRDRIHAAVEQAITQQGLFDTEMRSVWADGSLHWIRSIGRARYDHNGVATRMIGVVFDITDRKQIEEAQRQGEERMRLAMEGAQMGTWDVDLLTGKAIWSDYHFTMLGFEPTPTREASEALWQNQIHPDDRERVALEWQQSRQDHRAYRIEYRVIRADNGQTSWLAAFGSFTYDAHNIPIRSIGVLFDISDRKHAEIALAAQEQRYRHIFEAINISIWEEDFSDVKAAINRLKATGVTDFRQYFTDHPDFVRQMVKSVQLRDVNQASLQLFGAQTKAELLNSLHQIFTPESHDAFIGELLTIAAAETHFAAETIVQTLQGDRRHVWFTITFPPASEPYDRVLVSLLDMSDRKRAEAALRQSEEQLRLAQQAAGAGVWDWDMTTNQVTWSDEYYQLYGLDPAIPPSYDNWLASIWEPDQAQVDQTVRNALKHRNNLNVEFRVLHPTRELCWLTAIGQTFYNADGYPIRMTGIALNITDRKHAEEALRNSAERLGVALSAAKLGDWSWAASTDIVTFSDYAAELFGIPPGPYMTWTEMQNLIHVNDRETARIRVEQAILEHSDYDVEYRVLRSDHTERWIAAKGRAQYDSAGQVLGMLGVVQDVTPRKQAEAEREQLLEREQSVKETLQHFIEHTPVAVVMLDRDMRYLFASHRWMQDYASGYTDLKGRSHYEVMTDMPDHWRQVHQRCLAGASEECEADFYRRADGSELWIHWEILPWYAGDEIGGIIIFAENITERKQAAQEREKLLAREQEARQEAEQANRIKDEFLAVLSHELRSPLNPILGWAKLLQTRQFDATGTTRALETIERNAKLQAQLIDDLLDVSRILRGKMALNVFETDLSTVIDAAIETVRLSAEAKHIEISKTVADNIGLVLGDAGRLQQIVWNLLSNAVKFTPEGGKIEVVLQRGHSASMVSGTPALSTDSSRPVPAYAQIQVIDTGKGITPDFLPYVFDYFRQEDGTTTRKFGGLGLGLAIVRYLTELHGGTVKVHSAGEGTGATFTITLPLNERRPTREREPEETDLPTLSNTRPPLAGLRILAVDDEADMRDLIVTILEQTGAETTIAASAREALDAFDRVKPDILISDIGMPEIDGYALMRQVRQLPPKQGGDILAIALTAYAGEADQQQALAAGFQQHIAKPIEPQALVSAIITLVKS